MVRKAYLNVEKLRETVAGKRKGNALSQHLKISRNTLQRRLTGEFKLTLDQLNEICEFIGVDVDEFLEIKKAA